MIHGGNSAVIVFNREPGKKWPYTRRNFCSNPGKSLQQAFRPGPAVANRVRAKYHFCVSHSLFFVSLMGDPCGASISCFLISPQTSNFAGSDSWLALITVCLPNRARAQIFS